jgi:hypothetical protein
VGEADLPAGWCTCQKRYEPQKKPPKSDKIFLLAPFPQLARAVSSRGALKQPEILWIPLQIDPELRRRFKGYLFDGFSDALTFFRTQSDIYTCWPISRNNPERPVLISKRQENIGWRTDYFLVSPTLRDSVYDCSVLKDIMGSRNAPIKLVLDLPDPDNPPPKPPPEPEPDYQPDFAFDPTYAGGDPSNPYS